MRSSMFSENIAPIKHVPAAFAYISWDFYYQILDFTHGTCSGVTYISGAGTQDSIGDFIMLRRKGIVLTKLKITPFSRYK